MGTLARWVAVGGQQVKGDGGADPRVPVSRGLGYGSVAPALRCPRPSVGAEDLPPCVPLSLWEGWGCCLSEAVAGLVTSAAQTQKLSPNPLEKGGWCRAKLAGRGGAAPVGVARAARPRPPALPSGSFLFCPL